MTDVSNDIEVLRKKVAEQTELIGLLEARIEDLTEKKADAGGAGLDWDRLAANDRAQLWTELGLFVDRLVRRLDLQREILPCWWRHPRVVEDLTGLLGARKVAYADDADMSMPSWWLDLFERSRMRIRSELSGCGEDHVYSPLGPWMSDADREAFSLAVPLGRDSGGSGSQDEQQFR